MGELPSTLIGLLGLAAALIISDWVKNRGKVQRDESKVSELSQQTKYLHDIKIGLEVDREANRKMMKHLKRMRARVDEIHVNTKPNKV